MNIAAGLDPHSWTPSSLSASAQNPPEPPTIGGLLDNPARQATPTLPAESGVTVKIHPVSSLGLSGLAALSLQGDPDEPTCSGTTPSERPRASPRARMGRSRVDRTTA